MSTNLNMGAIRLEVAHDTNKHVRKALPPSLTVFRGAAEIKYYVKATVGRPQFYKENYRGVCIIREIPFAPSGVSLPPGKMLMRIDTVCGYQVSANRASKGHRYRCGVVCQTPATIFKGQQYTGTERRFSEI